MTNNNMSDNNGAPLSERFIGKSLNSESRPRFDRNQLL